MISCCFKKIAWGKNIKIIKKHKLVMESCWEKCSASAHPSVNNAIILELFTWLSDHQVLAWYVLTYLKLLSILPANTEDNHCYWVNTRMFWKCLHVCKRQKRLTCSCCPLVSQKGTLKQKCFHSFHLQLQFWKESHQTNRDQIGSHSQQHIQGHSASSGKPDAWLGSNGWQMVCLVTP